MIEYISFVLLFCIDDVVGLVVVVVDVVVDVVGLVVIVVDVVVDVVVLVTVGAKHRLKVQYSKEP